MPRGEQVHIAVLLAGPSGLAPAYVNQLTAFLAAAVSTFMRPSCRGGPWQGGTR